jgi:hypothetical protein
MFRQYVPFATVFHDVQDSVQKRIVINYNITMLNRKCWAIFSNCSGMSLVMRTIAFLPGVIQAELRRKNLASTRPRTIHGVACIQKYPHVILLEFLFVFAIIEATVDGLLDSLARPSDVFPVVYAP